MKGAGAKNQAADSSPIRSQQEEAVVTSGLMNGNKGALSSALGEAASTHDHPLICLG
jgi:hypothetical protein